MLIAIFIGVDWSLPTDSFSGDSLYFFISIINIIISGFAIFLGVVSGILIQKGVHEK